MNKKIINSEKIIINATGQPFGRLASRIAFLLAGKKQRNFCFEKASPIKVVVENINQVKISKKKLDQRIYFRYTGYPGGIRKKTMRELFTKQPEYLFREAVRKMLPRNRQRPILLKNLSIKK